MSKSPTIAELTARLDAIEERNDERWRDLCDNLRRLGLINAPQAELLWLSIVGMDVELEVEEALRHVPPLPGEPPVAF